MCCRQGHLIKPAMLSIKIPSNGPFKIDFSTFWNYLLPVPPKGVTSGVNNDVVLLFDNEAQAASYANELKLLPGSQKRVSQEIVNAIDKDLTPSGS